MQALSKRGPEEISEPDMNLGASKNRVRSFIKDRI